MVFELTCSPVDTLQISQGRSLRDQAQGLANHVCHGGVVQVHSLDVELLVGAAVVLAVLVVVGLVGLLPALLLSMFFIRNPTISPGHSSDYIDGR